MAQRIIKIIFLLFVFYLPMPTYAYPEMVRAGYANCLICHYSPSGSGILTPYGRALSQEVLSTSSGETEGKFLWGMIETPKAFQLGGDIRVLQSYQDSATRTNLKFIFMQADAEAALDLKNFVAVATAGVDHDGNPISRRHYAMYKPDKYFSFRAGKFSPAFGLNTENHSIGVRRGLGKDQGTETYNLELAWNSKTARVLLTGIAGRPDNTKLGYETGLSLSGALQVKQTYQLGLSYYYGARDVESRHVGGPFAILGFTKRFFLMLEADLQSLSPKTIQASQSNGFVENSRLDYEAIQGLHFYLTQEWSRLDFSNSSTVSNAYGGGIQFFPRPHFELNLNYQKQRFGGVGNDYQDIAFLMSHFYF